MALSVKLGSFNTNIVVGNQAVTGVGFQPKVVLFLGGRVAADPSTVQARMSIGAAVSPTLRWTAGYTEDDGGVSSNTSRVTQTDACYATPIPGGGSNQLAFDFVSMDADGFTINLSVADGTARPILYLALAGTDLTNVRAGSFAYGTATGNLGVTGVGFQPDLLLFALSRADTLNGPTTGASLGIGCAKSSTARWAGALFGADAANPSNETSAFLLTRCLLRCAATDVIDLAADFVSMDADGFTINRLTAPAADSTVLYLALQGTYRSAVGTFDQPAVTGNQAITGVGFQPLLALFASQSKATNAGASAASKLSVGAAVSATARWCRAAACADAVSPQLADSIQLTTGCLRHIGAGTPTIDAAADFVSQDAGGFTINWSTAGATARVHGYLALAGAVSLPPIQVPRTHARALLVR